MHGCSVESIMCVLCLLTDFCWMCLGDWKTHGSEYYECSRYKENPDIVNQSQQAQAREALKKYLFYFERVSSLGPQLYVIHMIAQVIFNKNKVQNCSVKVCPRQK